MGHPYSIVKERPEGVGLLPFLFLQNHPSGTAIAKTVLLKYNDIRGFFQENINNFRYLHFIFSHLVAKFRNYEITKEEKMKVN